MRWWSLMFLCRYGQTEPPSIPVDELFEEGKYPEGEIVEHPRECNAWRVSFDFISRAVPDGATTSSRRTDSNNSVFNCALRD